MSIEEKTVIQITKKVRELLKKQKIIKREPYNDVIKRLIKNKEKRENDKKE